MWTCASTMSIRAHSAVVGWVERRGWARIVGRGIPARGSVGCTILAMITRTYKTGQDRERASFLPPRLADYIAADDPVRAIDAYVRLPLAPPPPAAPPDQVRVRRLRRKRGRN